MSLVSYQRRVPVGTSIRGSNTAHSEAHNGRIVLSANRSLEEVKFPAFNEDEPCTAADSPKRTGGTCAADAILSSPIDETSLNVSMLLVKGVTSAPPPRNKGR